MKEINYKCAPESAKALALKNPKVSIQGFFRTGLS